MGLSLDQVNNQRYMEESKGTKVDAQDVELAVRLTIQMLNEGGALDIIRQAINQSKDPAQVIGQLLANIAGKLAEKLRDEYQIDPRIFLAKDGWLEKVLDYIEQKLGYPKNFSDQIYQQTLEVIKAAAQGPQAPNNAMDGADQDQSQEGSEMPNTPEEPGDNDPRLPRQPGGNL